MNSRRASGGLASLFGIAAWCIAGAAPALTLQTVVAPIYQVGNGATVNLGHTVLASTNYNRLIAGGAYSAVCNARETLPTTGQRTLSADNVIGGLRLIVTIPEWHPAQVNMPGFNEAVRGQTMTCTYNWTSRAIEGGYSIGVGGISYQTGSGERSEGGTQLFTMNVPSLGDEGGWTICIP